MRRSSSVTDHDDVFMRRALVLAENHAGHTSPNPMVGCVIVKHGKIIAEGAHRGPGHKHAEIEALVKLGGKARGATVYVNMEPCTHRRLGKVPCAVAVKESGAVRVVVGSKDTFPGHGGGITALRRAGIAVSRALVAECDAFNRGFLVWAATQRPAFTLKAALTLDGKIATVTGDAKWITGEAARADGHAWRKRAGAVLTGVGTVREDDPRLDVRFVQTARQPLRIVVDSRLETPLDARIVAPPGQVLLYAAIDDIERRRALEARAVEIALAPSPSGKVDLAAMLADLGRRGINELHVEAGEKLNASLLAAGLVDELLVYVAPRLVGSGRGLAALGPIARLDDALGFAFTRIDTIGDDLRLMLRPRPAEDR